MLARLEADEDYCRYADRRAARSRQGLWMEQAHSDDRELERLCAGQ